MAEVNIDKDVCVGCGECSDICPNDVFEYDAKNYESKVVNEEDCIGCLSCSDNCRADAIKITDVHLVKELLYDPKLDLKLRRMF